MIEILELHLWKDKRIKSLDLQPCGIGLHVKVDKMDYMCFNQSGDISKLNGDTLKHLWTSSPSSEAASHLLKITSTHGQLSIWLSVIWKSDQSDKIKRNFFQTATVSILLYKCTTWTLIKRMEKKLDHNCTRMLWAILNKSWKQHPTKQ